MPRLDHAAVNRTDQLINDIAAGRPAPQHDRLAIELAAYRELINSIPIPDQPDINTAMLAIRQGRAARSPWRWTWLALLIGLVILALALTGCQEPARPAPSTFPSAQTVSDPVSGTAKPSGGEKPGVADMPDILPTALIVPPSNHVTGTYPVHCTATGGRPDLMCTPGSMRSDITQDNIGATICNSQWSTRSIRAPKGETDWLKTVAMAAYGVSPTQRSVTELDHDVPLWMGGSNDVTNLWPQVSDLPGKGFRNSKDDVETKLHTAVCSHRVTLRDAQVAIATNWTTALVVLHVAA